MPENFLAGGIHELQRRYARFALRRKVRRQAANREAALTALGQRAWEEKIDLASFVELRDRLSALDTRVGEISQTKSTLESSLAALEQERKTELDTFTGRRRAVQDKKNPIDASLTQIRSRKTECERTIALGEVRLAAIPADLAAADRDKAAAGADAAKGQAASDRRARLAAEQTELGPKLAAAREALPGLAADERRLAGASQQHAGEIAAIDAEQKVVLGKIDAESSRVRAELDGAARQATAAQKERGENFGRLGQGLYDAHIDVPALAEPVARVAAIDRSQGDSEAALERSLVITRGLAPGTMGRFWGVVAAAAVVVLVLVAIANRSSNPPGEAAESSAPSTAAQATVPAGGLPNPRTPEGKAQIVQQFTQLGPQAGPKLRADAVGILKLDLETIASTADPTYLPLLRTLLRSDEAELRKSAVDAIAVIGPTTADKAELTRLLNDRERPVAAAAKRALAAMR